MIEYKAKINVLDNVELASDYYTNSYRNNISTCLPLNKVETCKNPFIFGVSKFGDGSALFSEVNYYIHKYLSGETLDSNFPNKEHYAIPNPIEIRLKSKKELKSLTFVFDTYNNVYPCEVYLDTQLSPTKYDKEINNAMVTIFNPEWQKYSNDEYTYYITFKYLNKPKRPLVITGIYSGEEIEVRQRNMVSISRTLSDRADFKLPSFGIISNAGEIEFNDYNGKILEYANNGLLKEGLECKLYLNNSLYNVEQEVGTYQTSNWQYDNDNRKVSVSLKDDLEEWQDINIEGFSYDAKNRPEYNLAGFYDYLHDRTPTKYEMLSFDELDSETQGILNNIIIKYPMLKSGSLWQQWTKICQVAQAHIYKLDNGRTTFVYKGGN